MGGQELFTAAAASVRILLQLHSTFLAQDCAQAYVPPAAAAIVSGYFTTRHLIVPFISPEGRRFNTSVGLNLFCGLLAIQGFMWWLS